MLLRGPTTDLEILDCWPELRQKQAIIFRRGRTWLIRSPLRKRSAPERTGTRAGWRLIAAGHCFACGHAGHSESNCPCHRSKCRICGSSTHTAEVCSCSSKKLSLTTAAKKVGVLRKALKYIKDYRAVIPPSLCRLIEEASAVASDLLDSSKQKPRRRLNIIRPGQQAQAGPRGASAPMDAVIPPFSTPVSPAFAAAAAPEAGDVADHPVPRQPISTDTAAPAQSTDAPVTPSHKRQRSPGTPAEGSDKAPHKLVQSSISQFGTACSTPLTSKAATTTTASPDDNKVSSPPHKRTNSGSGANKDKNKRT